MTIKQIWEELLDKKWDWDDLFWLILMIVIASMFTTPLLGIPIGIGIYFCFFMQMRIWMKWQKNIILNLETRSRTRIYADKIY